MVLQKFLKTWENKKIVYKDSAKIFRTIWRSSKKCKITHYSQSFCPAPHKPTSNLNILKANLGTLFLLYNGIVQGDNYFCWKVSVIKIHKVSVSMNKVQGAPPLQQCLSLSLPLSFLKSFVFPSIFLFLNFIKAHNRIKGLSKTYGLSPW